MLFQAPHRHICRLVKVSPEADQRVTYQDSKVEDSSKKQRGEQKNVQSSKDTGHPDYAGEHMPNPFWKRLDWTLDLVTSLRDLHWSWRSSRIPPITRLGARNVPRRPLQATTWLIFIYLGLDALNIIAKTEPYFWGTIDPSDKYISKSHNYHIFITFLNLMFANLAVFNIPRLLCVHVPGPRIVGLFGEPCMYTTALDPIRAILEDGLQGFWNL